MIDGVAGNGGYIMDASAIMQNDTNIENLRAMTETTREYGVYSGSPSSAYVAPPAPVPGYGGEGVGLLRTEFLFESSTAEPTVEEQCASLKAIVEELGSRQLIVRTADIGGDKPVSWMHIPHEDNPFLGMRGIRLSFKYEDMFRRQLEAIYRTAIWQKETTGSTGLHIMFPMIGRISEWNKARNIAEERMLDLLLPKNLDAAEGLAPGINPVYPDAGAFKVDVESPDGAAQAPDIPDTLPMLPVRDVVVFPYMILPLFVGREKSVAAVEEALEAVVGRREAAA